MSPATEVTVRYWAAARAAAGTDEEVIEHVSDLAALLDVLRERHGSALAGVLARSSFLVDETSPGRERPLGDVPLAHGAVVDVLPPFAGGAS